MGLTKTKIMTTEQVLKFYEISFLNETSSDGSKSNYFLGGDEMETYFTFLRDPKTIENEIIPVVDHYINGNPFPIDNDITVEGGYFVDVTLSGVTFINPETHQIDLTVPLDQFRLILQSWADNNKTNR